MAILALAVGTFAIGSGEFGMMGMLPHVAQSFGATIPQCGNIVSAYALGVVVGAPLVSLLIARLSRRHSLLLLTSWFAATNMLATVSHTVFELEIWRFLAGMSHGPLFGGSALVAASLAPPGRQGRAVGHVFAGLTIANVVGAPFATFAGDFVSWRDSYIAIGGIAALAVVLMAMTLPSDVPRRNQSILSELSLFRRRQVWYVLGVVMLGCGGMFCVYTYVSAALLHVTHVPEHIVPLYLSLWGLGMVAGAYIGSAAIDRNPLAATVGGFVWNIVTLSAFALTVPHLWPVTVTVFLLGGTIALGPAMQMRLMAVAGDAQTMAASLNHAAFNMANAIGAWAGAACLASGLGYAATGWAGAAIAALGLVLFLAATAAEKRDERQAITD